MRRTLFPNPAEPRRGAEFRAHFRGRSKRLLGNGEECHPFERPRSRPSSAPATHPLTPGLLERFAPEQGPCPRSPPTSSASTPTTTTSAPACCATARSRLRFRRSASRGRSTPAASTRRSSTIASTPRASQSTTSVSWCATATSCRSARWKSGWCTRTCPSSCRKRSAKWRRSIRSIFRTRTRWCRSRTIWRTPIAPSPRRPSTRAW